MRDVFCFDSSGNLGEMELSSDFLVPLGVVDPNSPPIAGEDGENAADGLTTRTLYDSNLANGVGLGSAAALSVSKNSGQYLQCWFQAPR